MRRQFFAKWDRRDQTAMQRCGTVAGAPEKGEERGRMTKAKPSIKATATSKAEEPRRLMVKVYVNEREQTQIRVAAAMTNQAMTEFCRAALVESLYGDVTGANVIKL